VAVRPVVRRYTYSAIPAAITVTTTTTAAAATAITNVTTDLIK
jgi:hypothetical protein